MKPIFFCLLSFIHVMAATASSASDDIASKLLENATSQASQRQVSQLINNIERGRLDQAIQSTIQAFFHVAPDGRLTKASLKQARDRDLARQRVRFLSQYLIHDLDGNGAISSAEVDSAFGSEVAQLISLRALADTNEDGEISTEEMFAAATAQAAQNNMRGDDFNHLLGFDLNDDGVVLVDEAIAGLRALSGDAAIAPSSSSATDVTNGTFSDATDAPTVDDVVTTNADGWPIELHMIGIYEPMEESAAGKRLPVQIQVDRPGVAVVLVLGSYDPAQWIIETTEGTTIEKIIASDRNRPRGAFTLNGENVSVTFRKLPLAYQARGIRFQPFHAAASQAARVANATSFNGAYRAPAEGFVIKDAPGVPTRDEVLAALAEQALPASELPPKLRDAFEGKIVSPGSLWTLRNEGFVGKDGDKTIHHNLPIEAPDVSWPVGVAHDPESQTLWGVTFGGEGFLYEFDIANETWTARSMNDVDVGGIIFDPATGHLITTPGRHGRNRYLVLDRSAKVLSSLAVKLEDYPGLIETYDPGNGPSPNLQPVMIEGDLMLVRAQPERRAARHQPASNWTYVVNLKSGTVQLVR